MDTLPQGLPQDNRRIVRELRNDPLYGGPPASAPGVHPDLPRESPFGMPLPNFEGLYWDGLPCHISSKRLREHVYERVTNDTGTLPTVDGVQLRVQKAWVELYNFKHLRYFASQQPLTVEPLADGSNIMQAEEGSIEFDFRAAFSWYSRYLEWLHYDSITDERLDRLAQLRSRVLSFLYEQHRSDDRKSNTVNALFPMPPVLQDWIWPWQFFLTWHIRQELLADDADEELPTQDMSVQVLNLLVKAEYRIEHMMLANTEDNLFMPEDRFVPALNVETENTPLQEWTVEDADELIRNITFHANRVFHLKALRHWGFKRPWKKLWLIFDPKEISDGEWEQQLLDRVIVGLQQRLHADVYGSQLLAFHPILPRQVNDMSDCCALGACGGEPWKTDDQIMETVCGHIACFDCMINYWESHVRSLHGATPGDWPCPFCRQSPGKLRTRINIAHTQGLGADIDLIADTAVL